MKIKIIEKNTNKLLDRLEVHFEVEAEKETPKRLEVRSKLAALINYDENLVVIKGIHQETGNRISKGVAHAYKSVDTLKHVEPEYLIKRNTPKPPKE
ncbi:MAG: 30S ribosomal protein S24e [Candidatus Heimdallarchaeota archaeon]|nr:30S ribosomal protein S24e [Candidatus Heimdallarchaeota archaeon]MBY8993288.1 30S ribosomal protein S24e [Candidatus Heimdallarchaeota archaeon]